MNYIILNISKMINKNVYLSYQIRDGLILFGLLFILILIMRSVNKHRQPNSILKSHHFKLMSIVIGFIFIGVGFMFITQSNDNTTQALNQYHLEQRITHQLQLDNTDIFYVRTSGYQAHRGSINIPSFAQSISYVPQTVRVKSDLKYTKGNHITNPTIGYIKHGTFVAANETGRQYLVLMQSVYEITDNNQPQYLSITNDSSMTLIATMHFNHQVYRISVDKTNISAVKVLSQY